MNSCSEPVHYLDGRIGTFFFIIRRVFFIHFITFALQQTGNARRRHFFRDTL
jgi:hypothetical protein